MFEQFLEIAYEAELNTEENEELLQLARELCDEDPATRTTAIAELREMIYERGECKPYRNDDEFLLRFLRARSFVVRKAHRNLVRYCKFLEQYPYLYKGVDLFGLDIVKDCYEGTLVDNPEVGRVTVFRFGMWDPNEFPIETLMKAGMATTEIGVRQPKLQVIGAVAIVDLEGVTLRHVATLTPAVTYQIVSLMGVATPGRLRACHIVNYSWIINSFFYMFKRFIPQGFHDKIFFHGYDLKSLQKHIRPECLPIRYGGTCRSHFPVDVWFQKIRKYRNSKFDEDMRAMGYVIKE